MFIAIIVVLVLAACFVLMDWAIYHSPILDDDGHERAAEREDRWYPFKP